MGEGEETSPDLQGGPEGGPGQKGSSIQDSERSGGNDVSLRVPSGEGGGGGGDYICKKHQEPLKVFCQEDLSLICLVCDKSRQHRTHLVLPIEEAAQDYKPDIEIRLQKLKREASAVQGLKLAREKEMAECLEDIKVKREKIVLECWQLRQFLEEQERHFLAQLDELEKKMQKEQEEDVRQLDGTLSLLNSIISDLEKDCQKPDAEFLQNLKETYTRVEKATLKTLKSPPNMEQAINAISQKSIALRENIRKFKETLAVELKRERRFCQNDLPEEQADHLQVLWTCEDARNTSTEGSVTLDPRTAHARLLLSPDGKTARHWGYPRALPDNPERFDSEPFVLGCVGFCTGRHSWKVAIEQGQSWAVGVARASVKRKGPLCLSPKQGVWAVEQSWGQFRALTSQWTPLPLARVPKRIQVCLDCEGGWVTFSNAELDVHIFTFPPISFKQERIYPWFWVGPECQLSLYC